MLRRCCLRQASLTISKRTSASSSFTPKQIDTVPSDLHKLIFGTAGPSTAVTKQLALELPRLRGNDIVQHFRSIADEQAEAYLSLLEQSAARFSLNFDAARCGDKEEWTEFLRSDDSAVVPRSLSEFEWKMQTGWTRYSHEDGSVTQVPYPEEDVFFYDVEVCVPEGPLPTLAVALSDKAWYGWCSDRLVNDTDVPKFMGEEHLIPLGGRDSPRVAIGHNVGYDRARAREPYSKEKTQLRFMDTMSMSLPMFGMADHQTAMYGMDDSDVMEMSYYRKEEEGRPARRKESLGWYDTWKERVSKNSLLEVTRFTAGIPINKAMQSFFVKSDVSAVRKEFQDLFRYCAEDTLATAVIFSKMWPEFRRRFPENVTLLGMLNMGNAYLPVNRNWRMFYQNNMESCEYRKVEAAQGIIAAARDVAKKLKEEGGNSDLWMWPHHVDNEAELNPRKKVTQYPSWYYKLFKTKSSASIPPEEIHSNQVILKSALIPSLFGMLYGPFPLFKSTDKGWGYISPVDKGKKAAKTVQEGLGIDPQLLKSSVAEFTLDFGEIPLPDVVTIRYKDCDFYKIPHPDGVGNVGDVLAKPFFKHLETKVIRATRHEDIFEKLLDSTKTTRFWTNYRERVESELAVWYDPSSADPPLGAIAPAIVAAGTISRRSVHKLWVTLTNSSDEKKIGTGIKTMVQAPPGMCLVGADVDSQEQWLAGVFGDASVAQILPESERVPGLTPFSNMMLAGSKSDGSDLHTVVAKQLKISRNDAKVLNYARLYGSGEKHAVQLLQRGMKSEEAEEVAANLFALTKGTVVRCRQLKSEFVPLFREFEASFGEKTTITVLGKLYIPTYDSSPMFRSIAVEFENWVLEKLRQEGKEVVDEEVIPLLYENMKDSRDLYHNGYESATFNFLEQEAKDRELRTPVLGCQLSDALALLPEGTPDGASFAQKYKRSVMNWIVQSSAVDFLHLLLVSMDWLCKEYGIDARFVISIHDEVRYLCTEEEAPRVGLALMLSHLYVRSFISHRVGFRQLPMSVAFFSQVDCDTVLRKEVDSPCSNPDGTPVPNGITWNIDDLIKITGGSLKKL